MDIETRYLFITDIWQLIIEYVDSEQQYSIINNDSVFKQKLYIYDLSENSYFIQTLDDDLLKQHCFHRLRKFNANCNKKITDVNYMQQLEELYADFDCGIDNNSIKQLTRLKILNANYNNKITDVNHMQQLENSEAQYGCGIDNNGIKQLTRLKILYANNNKKITDVNHMQQLEELYTTCNN